MELFRRGTKSEASHAGRLYAEGGECTVPTWKSKRAILRRRIPLARISGCRSPWPSRPPAEIRRPPPCGYDLVPRPTAARNAECRSVPNRVRGPHTRADGHRHEHAPQTSFLLALVNLPRVADISSWMNTTDDDFSLLDQYTRDHSKLRLPHVAHAVFVHAVARQRGATPTLLKRSAKRFLSSSRETGEHPGPWRLPRRLAALNHVIHGPNPPCGAKHKRRHRESRHADSFPPSDEASGASIAELAAAG